MASNPINSLCIIGFLCLVLLHGTCGRGFNDFVEETKDAKSSIKDLNDYEIPADVPATLYGSYAYQPTNVFHYAAYQSKEGIYNGVEALLDVYNFDLGSHLIPTINDKFTSSQIWIENGENENLNSIQAGWHVFPAHYGDSMTHFFTSWTSKGFRDGCYDLQCTGFQPGFQPGNITYFPGIELESSNISLKVSKDIKTGDWWVYLNNIPLGYYPKGLFITLGNSGTVVSIGGLVSFTKGQMSPPMGSGNFSDNGKETAQIRKIKLINATGGEQYPSPTDFTPVPDDHKCFKISPITDSESHDGYYFSYGGPAGCTS